MIALGLLCVLGGLGLLVVGLTQPNETWVRASIALSLFGGLVAVLTQFASGRVPVSHSSGDRSANPSQRTARRQLERSGLSAAASGRAGSSAVARNGAAANGADAYGNGPYGAGAHGNAPPDRGGYGTRGYASAAYGVAGDYGVGLDGAPTQGAASNGAAGYGDRQNGELAPDDTARIREPPEESVRMGDLLTVIDLADEVLVIDGRAHYHLAICLYIRDAATVGLPINQAREVGFTPCGQCRPDSTLAAQARRLRR